MHCAQDVGNCLSTRRDRAAIGLLAHAQLLRAPARFETPPTSFAADATVLVVMGMTFTLGCTRFAEGSARVNFDSKELPVDFRLARQGAGRGFAEVGAIQIQAYTAAKRVDLILG
jgi:hypothetical protein